MGDRIDRDELHAIFGPDIPLVAVKLLFPENSEPLTTQELRQVLRALPAASAEDVRAGALAVADALDAWADAQRQGRQIDASITGLRDMAKVVRALIPEARP